MLHAQDREPTRSVGQVSQCYNPSEQILGLYLDFGIFVGFGGSEI